MSTLSTQHSITKYDAKTSKASEGQRLSKACYKTPKDGKGIKKDNVCASIPVLSAVDISTPELNALKPYLVSMLHDTQDAILRERSEAGATSLSDTDISIASCIAWLDEDSKGGRLTKEFIVEWFMESLNDTLTVAIADKLGISDNPSEEQSVKIAQMCAVYRDSFASLAGGKTSFTPEKAIKMGKVLEYASEEDVLASKFKARLVKMQQADTADMLAL